MNAPPSESGARRLTRFLGSELHGVALAWWRPFWKITLGQTILCFAVLAFYVLRDPAEQPRANNEPPLLVKLVWLFGFSLVYAVPVGMFCGGACVVWRLCGWGIVVPIVLIPLALASSLWLCSGWIQSSGGEALDALAKSAQDHGFPETQRALEGFGRALHGGGIEMLGALGVLLLPFVVVDGFWILLDTAFLGQFVEFLLVFATALCLGLIPATLFSFLVLSVVVVKRMKQRYRNMI